MDKADYGTVIIRRNTFSTLAPQQKWRLFDYRIGAAGQRDGYGNTERRDYRGAPPFKSLRAISPAATKHKVPAAARINGTVKSDVSSGPDNSCAPIRPAKPKAMST